MKKYMKLLFGIMIVFLCMGAGEKNVNGAELPITAEHFSAEWLREVLSSTTYDIDGNGAFKENNKSHAHNNEKNTHIYIFRDL